MQTRGNICALSSNSKRRCSRTPSECKAAVMRSCCVTVLQSRPNLRRQTTSNKWLTTSFCIVTTTHDCDSIDALSRRLDLDANSLWLSITWYGATNKSVQIEPLNKPIISDVIVVVVVVTPHLHLLHASKDANDLRRTRTLMQSRAETSA